MTWKLVITKPAERALRTIPRVDLEHIDNALEEMCSDPYFGDVRFLRGSGGALRRRVGDWRIFFELNKDKQLIIVLAVKRRGSKTY